MFILAMLFDTTGRNLLLGYIPESLGLLLFGALLIVFAASLRWFLGRGEELGEKSFVADARHITEQA